MQPDAANVGWWQFSPLWLPYTGTVNVEFATARLPKWYFTPSVVVTTHFSPPV
jgi:hypothetical protein